MSHYPLNPPFEKLGLRYLILKQLRKSTVPITPKELLYLLQKYKTPYIIDLSKIQRIIQKLVRQGLVEFVYVDLSYGIRLTTRGKEEFDLVTKH